MRHELTISRFRLMVETACRESDGKVELIRFEQGATLHSQIQVPELAFDQARGIWYETSRMLSMPFRPDALFSLRLMRAPAGKEEFHFFFEADRKTITKLERIRNRFRAYFHFIVKQRLHREIYGVQNIRAVLFETLDGQWGERLREEARHPIVTGHKPSPLFWFTASTLFTRPDVPSGTQAENQEGVKPVYLSRPEFVLEPIWATPVDDTFHSLLEL